MYYRNPVLVKIEQEKAEEDRRVSRIFLGFIFGTSLTCAWVIAQVVVGLIAG